MNGIEVPIHFDFAAAMREFDAMRARIASNPINVGVSGTAGSLSGRLADMRAASGAPLTTEQIRQARDEANASAQASRQRFEESRQRQRAQTRMNTLNNQTFQAIELDNKTRGIIANQRMQYWRQEANRIRERLNDSQTFQNLKGMGTMAGLGVAGLTASGFSGTIEGNRFNTELRVLSLELAATFKPLQEAVTGLVRRLRRNLQAMDQDEQNRLQRLGLAAAGGYLGARVAGPKGAVVGAAAGYMFGEELDRLSEKEKFQRQYMQENSRLMSMKPEERLAEIERMRKEISDNLKKDGGLFSNKSPFGEERLAAMRDSNYKKEVLKSLEEGTKRELGIGGAGGGANPDRRQLMITEGTGFYGAGSTWFALQETVITTLAAESEKQTRMLENISSSAAKTADGVANLNK